MISDLSNLPPGDHNYLQVQWRGGSPWIYWGDVCQLYSTLLKEILDQYDRDRNSKEPPSSVSAKCHVAGMGRCTVKKGESRLKSFYHLSFSGHYESQGLGLDYEHLKIWAHNMKYEGFRTVEIGPFNRQAVLLVLTKEKM